MVGNVVVSNSTAGAECLFTAAGTGTATDEYLQALYALARARETAPSPGVPVAAWGGCASLPTPEAYGAAHSMLLCDATLGAFGEPVSPPSRPLSGSQPRGRPRGNGAIPVSGDKERRSALYKTELCRSWETTGTCKYGAKCQFAHSRAELRHVERHPKYKTEPCKTFLERGTCPYGSRCCFVHVGADAMPSSGTAGVPRRAATPAQAPIPRSQGRSPSISRPSSRTGVGRLSPSPPPTANRPAQVLALGDGQAFRATSPPEEAGASSTLAMVANSSWLAGVAGIPTPPPSLGDPLGAPAGLADLPAVASPRLAPKIPPGLAAGAWTNAPLSPHIVAADAFAPLDPLMQLSRRLEALQVGGNVTVTATPPATPSPRATDSAVPACAVAPESLWAVSGISADSSVASALAAEVGLGDELLAAPIARAPGGPGKRLRVFQHLDESLSR